MPPHRGKALSVDKCHSRTRPLSTANWTSPGLGASMVKLPVMPREVQRLREALRSSRYSSCAGLTHSFYHYPARFSPDIARAAIELFSEPEDVILDPFMGGGTTIIEGLRLGRRVLGVDLNALARFVANVRTMPLSHCDALAIREWAVRLAGQSDRRRFPTTRQPRNLPRAMGAFMAAALEQSERLQLPRQRAFARCVLLRLGQLALDCRDAPPRQRTLAERLPKLADELLAGLDQFVESCRAAGITKRAIARRRVLLHQGCDTPS